jgi:UPF0271 protein
MVELACDWGESFGPWRHGAGPEILELVTAVHLACGFHAGDPLTMLRAVEACAGAGVAVGAHPGWPDLVGFGRRELACSPAETTALVLYQIGALAAIARSVGVELSHVKPHGALYHQAACDPALAGAVSCAVAGADHRLAVVTQPGTELERAARELGLEVRRELFADRRYRADGSLLSRRDPRALLSDPAEAAAQVAQALERGTVPTVDGSEVAVELDTICIHGDEPSAVAVARAVRKVLDAHDTGAPTR